MKILMKWTLCLLLGAALVYALVAIPVNGQTVWQRIIGLASETAERPEASAVHKKEQAPAPLPGATNQKPSSDRLTDTDRQGLDQLIQSKLKNDGQESALP